MDTGRRALGKLGALSDVVHVDGIIPLLIQDPIGKSERSCQMAQEKDSEGEHGPQSVGGKEWEGDWETPVDNSFDAVSTPFYPLS
jgi:hypothetical protein